MKRVRIFVSALALFSASVFGAHSADDLVIPATQEDAYTPVEVGSGWYIRGDIGYDLSTSTNGSYRTFGDLDTDPLITALGYSTVGYDRFNFDTARSASGGIGYRFNDFFRGDITAGAWNRDVSGTDTDPGFTDVNTGDRYICGVNIDDPANPFPTATACRSTDGTRVSAIEVMANAYADLGTYVGFTPYIGAGIGMTRLSFDNLRNTSNCIDASGNVLAGCGSPSTLHGGLSSNRITYALMLGTAYDLTKNLKLDLGYRFSSIKGGDMFAFDSGTASLGATGVQGSHGDLTNHQIKMGLRYEIW